MNNPRFGPCSYCGGTGEEYIPALAGDGWTGRDCEMCNGQGGILVIDGEEYLLVGGNSRVYRDHKGRFAKIPDVAYGLDQPALEEVG